MSKGPNQKQKMLYLLKIFSEDTDEGHRLTLKEIAKKLNGYGVSADRKTLYLDFNELRNFGFDIIGSRSGRDFYYYLGERDFDLYEISTLMDSITASPFITEKKADELIEKLKKLTSQYNAEELQKQADERAKAEKAEDLSGETVRVTLEGTNDMEGVLIDRFGTDVPFTPVDEERFSAEVDVRVNASFIGWLISLGGSIRVTAPESLVATMKKAAAILSELYL